MKQIKQIKQISFYLLPVICCLIIGMTSCSDEYTEGLMATTDPHYLNVDKSSLTYTANGGTQQLGVQSTGVNWTLSNSTDWISLSETSGTADASVGVTASANTAYSDKGRAATLALSGSGATTRNITVNQESPSLLLTVSPSSVELAATAGSTADITITSNNTLTVSVGDDSWLTAKSTSTGITLTARENTTGASRTNTVSVSSGSKMETVKVTQKAANVTPSSESLSFGHAASSQTVSIKSDASWTIKTNTSWLDITPTSGYAGTTSINVAVTQNTSKGSRTGSFTVGTKEVAVTQEGVELTASTISMTFAEAGETLPLIITSNTTWKLSAEDDITLSQTSGEGNATVKVTMKENTGTVIKTIITLEATDGSGQSVQIPVTQNGSGITVLDNLDHFAKEGGSIVYNVPALDSWTASVPSEYSWIHITPTSGTKDATMTITVDKTTSIDDRNGYVILTYSYGAKYRLNVKQYGAGIATNISTYQFFAKGGNSDAITVQCTGTVTTSTSANWLTAKLNGNLLTITAAENLTGAVRNGTVTLSLSGSSLKVAISVTQASQHGDFVINGYGTDKDVLTGMTIDITGVNVSGYDGDEDLIPATPEAIDLGLSVKWATFNVGASAPEQYGDYYAWGETETKSDYDWSTYKWCKSSETTMTKYCNNSSIGTVDHKTTLDLEDDVAHVKWGGNWRMPTDAELTELQEKCTWAWTTLNGVNGYKVTGTNGNSIFLPAAGYRGYSDIYESGSGGRYWSSSLYDSGSFYAFVLYFYSSNVGKDYGGRCGGRCVRAVLR